MDVSPTIQRRHGRIRSITGTNPNAGVEISETVPDRRRWILHSINFQLVTSATVANRTIRFIITDGTNIIFHMIASTTQTASLTHIYYYSNLGTDEIISTGYRTYALPPIPLMAGYIIKTITPGLENDDNFSAPQLLVEEWTDP